MDISSRSPLRDEWSDARELADGPTRVHIFDLVGGHAERLSEVFYDAMFADPQAAGMLDHQVVNDRLHASMRRWLVELFDPAISTDVLATRQRRTGEVHARIGVPVPLVNRGARVLQRALFAQLAQSPLSRDALVQAAQYVHEMFSLAIGAMNSAFTTNVDRIARSEEAYRLFFLGQDMKAERERRRSELLEWAQQILERHYWAADEAQDSENMPSQFSLWLHHKASMLFDQAPEVELIRNQLTRVELELLPRLSHARDNHADARVVVSEINRCIDQIKDLLGTLFDHYLAVDDGRDSVTALLNRRYFPAIARREIELASARQGSFSVLMSDIDDFRAVADTWDHDASDRVLGQAAQLLQEQLRAGDFVFRVGDDEFLVLLVETDGVRALQVADALRRRFQDHAFKPAPGATVSLTLSMGVAAFDGHPDYQRLLDRADAALQDAKAAGPNRCVLAA